MSDAPQERVCKLTTCTQRHAWEERRAVGYGKFSMSLFCSCGTTSRLRSELPIGAFPRPFRTAISARFSLVRGLGWRSHCRRATSARASRKAATFGMRSSLNVRPRAPANTFSISGPAGGEASSRSGHGRTSRTGNGAIWTAPCTCSEEISATAASSRSIWQETLNWRAIGRSETGIRRSWTALHSWCLPRAASGRHLRAAPDGSIR